MYHGRSDVVLLDLNPIHFSDLVVNVMAVPVDPIALAECRPCLGKRKAVQVSLLGPIAMREAEQVAAKLDIFAVAHIN